MYNLYMSAPAVDSLLIFSCLKGLVKCGYVYMYCNVYSHINLCVSTSLQITSSSVRLINEESLDLVW